MISRIFLSLSLFTSMACSSQIVSIIPQPVSVVAGTGSFSVSKNTVIAVSDEGDRKAAEFLRDYLENYYGIRLDIDKQEGKDYIRLSTKKFIQAPDKDAYKLQVTSNGVSIEGDTYAGTFYGIQSLIQLFRGPAGEKAKIPFVTINDYPRFKYRGMHLDVVRHSFPLAFIKKYIDYLALHKLNYFHWHLTDDQGWRIEIKKYPRLQSEGAWRNGTIVGRYPGTKNDNTRYGGYFTQEEIKEVVQYAMDRHITVIPEIEMPGHSSAAIAAYPWLSCFPARNTTIPSHPSDESARQQANGKVKLVQETWGVFEDVFCAGKDSTFHFLQDVLDEVISMFPSPYIHIGGDESPKVHWKQCPNCQARIKKENLKDEHELQSYFIQRIEKYINSKGRTIIGWDEILEGGLAPNAIVMSWRGEEGGIEAAKQKHLVIMTPQKPLYFDHSQTRNEDSLTIGGYNPLEAVYAYDPVPKELPAGAAKYIMGAQANVWAEYIEYPSRVEYTVFPRMSALSEVVWSPKEKRNYRDFEKRLAVQFKRYEMWMLHFSKAYFDIKASIVPDKNYVGLKITAEANSKDGEIRYQSSSDVSPKTYTTPIVINKTGKLYFYYLKNNVQSNAIHFDLQFNKATGKKISITKTPNEKYPGQGGAFSLVNGVYSNKGLSYPDWLGWIGDDMEATIDLGKTTPFTSVKMHTLDQNGSWVYLPKYVEVLASTDGKKYTAVGRSSEFVKDTLTMGWITITFPKKSARYIKVIAKNYGLIPDGQPGAGTKAWLFADELQVE